VIWVALVLHVFAAFGIAYVLGYSKITLQGREWLSTFGTVGKWAVALLECPACLGFWIGCLATILKSGIPGEPLLAFSALHLGFFTCGTNFLLAKVTGLILDEGDSK
jgi:hypothetical protein